MSGWSAPDTKPHPRSGISRSMRVNRQEREVSLFTSGGPTDKLGLTDVLGRIAAQTAHRLNELLPCNWTPPTATISAQAV